MHRKKSREEVFLDEINVIISWTELTQVIVPFYPPPKGAGRRPIGIGQMLRLYFFIYQYSSKNRKPEFALHA